MKKLLYLCLCFVAATPATSQVPFLVNKSIDINKINATILVHGDMWWDPATSTQACEFPTGSGKQLMGASSIWMAGYDGGNVLHQSAQTYRQSGNDYWPGPLDNNGELSYITSHAWARIWKVNRPEINTFLATAVHTSANTPTDIFEWPAKNNPFARGNMNVALPITTDMAPFIDVNGDGDYNALDGDYPDMKGDQMLWWVFSDNGPQHNNSANCGHSLQLEIRAIAYGYKRNTAIDNVVFHEFNITNKSPNNYKRFRFGLWSDADLGYYGDDYIGFDSAHRMGIVYNGSVVDGFGQPNSYGPRVPMAGVSFLKMPGDKVPAYVPAGSFMYYNNDYSVMGNPEIDSDYDNYLRATWRNGARLKNTFAGPGIPSTGYGTGSNTNYVFPGDPSDKAAWSECISGNAMGDRRFVITTNDYTFTAGTTEQVAFALLATEPDTLNGCPTADFSKLNIIADSAWLAFGNTQPVSVYQSYISTKEPAIFPNPAHDILYIGNELGDISQVHVYDAMGRSLPVNSLMIDNMTAIAIDLLPPGLYHLVYTNSGAKHHKTFVKE